MAMRKDHAFVRVDPSAPRASGTCQRCGIRYSRSELQWQYEWQGMQLQNLRLLVCPVCYDEPNPQLAAFSPPPDPIPIMYPAPPDPMGVTGFGWGEGGWGEGGWGQGGWGDEVIQ